MIFTKKDLEQLKQYILNIKGFDQLSDIKDENRRQMTHIYLRGINSIIKDRGELSTDLILGYFATQYAADINYSRGKHDKSIRDKYGINSYTVYEILRYIPFDNSFEIPDDFVYDTSTKTVTTSDLKYKKLEKNIPIVTNQVFPLDYFKLKGFEKSEDKIEEVFEDLIIDSLIFNNSKKKEENNFDFDFDYANKGLVELQNIFLHAKTNEEKTESANKALTFYLCGKKNGQNVDDLEKVITNVLEIDKKQLEFLENVINEKNVDALGNHARDIKIFKKSIEKKINELKINSNEYFKGEHLKTKEEKQKGREIKDIISKAAFYKQAKDKYDEKTKYTGFFSFIRNYFSKESFALRKEMKMISKSLNNDGIDISKIDFNKGTQEISEKLVSQCNDKGIEIKYFENNGKTKKESLEVPLAEEATHNLENDKVPEVPELEVNNTITK